MRKQIPKYVFLALIIAIIMGNVSVQAHAVLSKEIGMGKVRFTFEDDYPLAEGRISVVNNNGKEIATGQADSDGVFDYSMYENVAKISITDSQGHHKAHIVESTQKSKENPDANPIVVVATVAVLVAVAAAFYFWNRKVSSVG